MAYARDHLRLDRVAEDGWSAVWSCPETELRWRETYLPAWRSSDPCERLDRLDRPGTAGAPATSPTGRRRAAIPRWAMAAVSATLVATIVAESI